MALEEYWEKRDFKKSREPEGKQGESQDSPIFVVQKHQATQLHYDFRLETEGVLKSWAIPKGPSLDPKVKRLAMMVEDHPFDYKNFEGVIDEGNYGAGKVIVWDQGQYLAAGTKNKRESEKKIKEGLRKGHLVFVLLGKKLQGEFALIRINEEKSEWLLSKAKDQYASDANLEKLDRSVVSGKKLTEIKPELSFDIEKYPKLPMPHNIRPMLATLTEDIPEDNEWLFEVKWDGYRAIAEIKEGQVYLYSRNGHRFNEKYPKIADELLKVKNEAILDGEIVAIDKFGKPHFQWLQDYQIKPQGSMVYYLFDILYIDGHDLAGVPLADRKEILKKILPVSDYLKYSDSVETEGKLFFKEAKKQRLEGIMAKNKGSRYKTGKRTKDWLKIKIIKRQEAVIGGFTEPGGGRQYFGSLTLGVYEKGKLNYIGNTGSGFDEKSLKVLYGALKKIEIPESPFQTTKITPKSYWVRPEFVCEIKFQEWTKEGTMRQPIFLGLRDDKEPTEVVRES